ncbi:MAG: hypothetical protein OXT72_10450 [Gammaproteobacteria bacterium]|nr:hypothetical protein [Gammaproteobacteria bacterium]MDE0246927.1 hypothetical protein [Gammaproteobacteria bacterium]
MTDASKPDPQGDLRMPDPIPDTPENVMRAILATPPKDDEEWDFTKGHEEVLDNPDLIP